MPNRSAYCKGERRFLTLPAKAERVAAHALMPVVPSYRGP
jgi:hypothetical protein